MEPWKRKNLDFTVHVDGYCDDGQRIVLIEVWAHIGKAKSAQKQKVLGDVLKLALLSRMLAKEKPDRTVESFIVFIDEEAAAVLHGKSWGAFAAQEFDVKTELVKLDVLTIQNIKDAQRRQDIRRPEEDIGLDVT
ncbi:MAG: hypothetical protein H0U76_19020 [Ktedonobacteraceae bacterium]|nr:hypothetical protein [Ktedonobacteraceae bacterium]